MSGSSRKILDVAVSCNHRVPTVISLLGSFRLSLISSNRVYIVTSKHACYASIQHDCSSTFLELLPQQHHQHLHPRQPYRPCQFSRYTSFSNSSSPCRLMIGCPVVDVRNRSSASRIFVSVRNTTGTSRSATPPSLDTNSRVESEDAIMATGEQEHTDMASYYYNVPGTFGSDDTMPTGSYI